MNTLIVIPTYNERNNIEILLNRLFSLDIKCDVLIVDDNSKDQTASFIKSRNDFGKRVFIIERPKKMGLGTAYIEGFEWGIGKGYDNIGEMDGDLSHHPEYLIEMLNALHQGNDAVIGSRYIHGISVINWPLSRLIISYFANAYTRIILGLKVFDTTSGFVVYKRKALENIPLSKIISNGYSFQIELKFRLQKKGFILKEYPIIFYERIRGRSKLSRSVVFEALFKVIYLRIVSILSLKWNEK